MFLRNEANKSFACNKIQARRPRETMSNPAYTNEENALARPVLPSFFRLPKLRGALLGFV